VHRADGGETSLSNLALLCRRHHRSVHERFDVRIADGTPIFTRRDGTHLEDRGPP
jgi:5-methylcytosine-specific restriction endonuclease McrA